ncbi:VWA domain-containing protein, partial [Neptunomonas qingdaonensis]
NFENIAADASANSVVSTIVDNDNTPSITTPDPVSVSEEGLFKGLADNSGTPVDTTDSASVVGTLNFTDQDDTAFDIVLSGPAGLLSNNETVGWDWDASSKVLTGSTPSGTVVLTVSLGTVVPTSGGNHSVEYTIDLKAPVDHPINSAEDILSLNFGVSVSDSGLNTDTNTFVVNIEDDRPVSGDIYDSIVIPEAQTNVMLVMDFSGSMSGSNLTEMKSALVNMLQAYTAIGEVAVQLVTFSTSSNTPSDAGWISGSAAIAYINALTNSDMGGWTNYDAALQEAQTAFAETNGKITGGDNVSYFISDGAPTAWVNPDGTIGAGSTTNPDVGIQSAEQAEWESFLVSNTIDSYAIGFGGASLAKLEPVAYNGVDSQERPALDATAAGSNLTDILLETIAEPTVGNLFGSLAVGGFGADGYGYVRTIEIDGEVYSYSTDTLVVTNSSGGTVSSDKSFTVTTDNNGMLTINMENGNYSYVADPALVNALTESFIYTMQDSDGDVTSGTVHLNVSRDFGDTPQITAPSSISVSEEGLSDGLVDTLGTPDTTDSATSMGTLSFVDADSSAFTVALTGPSGITSGGESVSWTWSAGTQVLTGSTAAGDVVMTVSLSTVTSSGASHTVNYTVDLQAPIDHSDAASENVQNLGFGVDISDGRNTSQATINVSVEDDSPEASNSAAQNIVITETDTNLLLVIDVSGSMGWDSGVLKPNSTDEYSRLEIAQQSMNALLDGYADNGDVKVRIVTFSSTADEQQALWVDIATAKTIIASLSDGGSTNYDAALAQAMDAFTDPGKLVEAQNISYFFSDGVPNRSDGNTNGLTNQSGGGNSDDGIQSAEKTIWENFLNTNEINSLALGMGTGVTASNLNSIAYNGKTSQAATAIIVSDLSQLESTLQSTIVAEPFQGNLLAGGLLALGAGFGADGGYMQLVTVDGIDYTYNPVTDQVDSDGTSVSGSVITVSTDKGGLLVLDMQDGSYSYQAGENQSLPSDEAFSYTVVDSDGDTDVGVLTLNVIQQNRIAGTDQDDTLVGTAGEDQLLGGAGNDILTGGDGDDLFIWSEGTASSNDVVTDFAVYNTAGDEKDVLDLSDLLQGETDTTLDQYLHFEESAGNTVVYIKSDGGIDATGSNADQVITLNGVTELNAGVQTDADIILQLLDNNQLIVD